MALNLNVELVTPEEIAEFFGVELSTVRRWLRTGWIKSKRIGRKYIIRREHVEELLQGHDEPAPVRHRKAADEEDE